MKNSSLDNYRRVQYLCLREKKYNFLLVQHFFYILVFTRDSAVHFRNYFNLSNIERRWAGVNIFNLGSGEFS
ncbi:MAG: hypothetical protein CMP11_07100 [Zetaproteobacteria bacterium]|nr:hypothetical protein [Pseudobdellovibrionaceae bacterium]